MEAAVACVEALQGHTLGTEMEFIIHTFTCRRNRVMEGKQGEKDGRK